MGILEEFLSQGILVRLLFQYFIYLLSIKIVKYWVLSKFYTVGDLMINKSDESNKDLDEILQKASDLELDIYERLISLCKVNGGTRPISIYVALLEEEKTYASAAGDPKNEMRKACILHLIKLVRSGVLVTYFALTMYFQC